MPHLLKTWQNGSVSKQQVDKMTLHPLGTHVKIFMGKACQEQTL